MTNFSPHTTVHHPSQLLPSNWNFPNSVANDLHGIHPYPARFIPEIPRTLLTHLPKPGESIVLDPFCGSGVTLSEAQQAGYTSVGIDLNPIACMISKVKTTPLPADFAAIAQRVAQRAQMLAQTPPIPNIPNLDHWFKPDIQSIVARLLAEIHGIPQPDLLEALRFCLSAILVKISNQESDTRYAAIEKNLNSTGIYSLFLQTAEKLVRAKQSLSPLAPARVLCANSLYLTEKEVPEKVGLVVTSPPYPNAYEYWLYHKYRMWWLGFDPLSVKQQEIGARAHFFKKNHHTVDDFAVQMQQLFAFLSQKVVGGGFVVVVVGRSKIHGQIIDNAKTIESVGQVAGFRHVQSIARQINPHRKSFNLSHARIEQEHIIILEKKP